MGGDADGFSGNGGDTPSEQEGLGADDETEDEKNLNADDDDKNADFIIVILASVAAVLCCIVCVAFLCLQRRKDKEEEARIQEEVMVKKTWMSNKKAYEEEMRMEEQETLKALAPEGETLPADEPEDDDESEEVPVEANAAKAIAGSNFLRRNRNRNGKSQRGRWGDKSLGSISENDSEGDMLDSDMEEESGFEIALENMEGGNSEASAMNSRGPVAIDESLTADPILSPEALARATTPPTNGESDSHFNWFLQVLNIRAASTDRPTPTESRELQTVEEESLAVSNFTETPSEDEEPGEIRSPSRGWSGPPPPIVPDEPPSTPTRGYMGARSHDSPARTLSPGGDIPIVPKSPMSPSDVLSVDDSMYLDESTMSPHSSKYSPKNRAMKQPMSPPGGASVLSGMTTKSPMSKDDAEADDFFNKPYSTPGAHYLMPSLGAARNSRRVERNEDGPSRSPTGFQRPTRAAEEFDGTESARGATTFGAGAVTSARTSRAGLFSRRQQPVEKLMPQYESDASVSDVDSVDQHQKMQFEQKQQDALQLQKDVRQWRPDPASSPKAKAKDSPSSDSKDRKKNSGSVWNSFLSELASAEEQFFNPKVSTSSTSKGNSRGRSKERGSGDGLRGKSPDPPPAPPLDQSDDLSEESPSLEQADSLDEDVPPPPDDLPPPPMTYNRSTSSNWTEDTGNPKISDGSQAPLPPMTYQRSTSSEINPPKGLTYVRSSSTAWTNESNTDYY